MNQGLSVRMRLPLASLTPPSSMPTTFQPPSSASPATTGTVRPLTSTTALNWPSNARNETSRGASAACRGIRSATPAAGMGAPSEMAGAAPAGAAAPAVPVNSDSSARFTSALNFAISARAFHKAICDCNAASSDASVCRGVVVASAATAALADDAPAPAAAPAALALDGWAAGVDAGGAASCVRAGGRAACCEAGCDACLRPASAIAAEIGSDMEDAAFAEPATDCSKAAAIAIPR
ncbi:protein of unknown function (plasmid) [Cupriavidus taiwanensis]|uniref:Uncharacterized protein n=1 Tax=Cupriavidus taiwanensis TaxID=164546 RepID=A0A7Z7JHV3_9BURK|nr:exported hypothetical protein [Cupriavidus taiwanensis]SOZ97029.1 exported hypothetical protein [Cupriavidus taiwanensis]SPC25898.1 exported hypothetical protein [Cupriavidus taiwanensis]SPD38077.1 protein of unknown function [Cupriavidus taiwanensis]